MRLRSRRVRASATGLIAAAVVAALFSGPPQISVAGHLVTMPSHFVFDVTSAWRIFSRFVIALEMALVILAAVGGVLGVTAQLTRRLGPGMVAHALINALVFLVLLANT